MIELFQFLGKFMKDGGIFMYPITFLLAFGVAVVVERAYVLFKKFNLDGAKYFSFVEQKITSRDIDGAIKASPDTPLSNIVCFGLEMIKKVESNEKIFPDDDRTFKGERRVALLMEKAVEEVAALEFPKVERRLAFLPTIANLATLLGLLGTLQGLIQSFSAVAGLDPSKKAQVLAQGISVAMNTTAYGLFVAVLILFSYSLINARAERIMNETEYYTLKFINLISMRY